MAAVVGYYEATIVHGACDSGGGSLAGQEFARLRSCRFCDSDLLVSEMTDVRATEFESTTEVPEDTFLYPLVLKRCPRYGCGWWALSQVRHT